MSLITELKSNLEYPELTFCEEMELLLEIKKRRIMNNTDQGRQFRALHEVRTRPLKATLVDEKNTIWMLEYNFKSFPSTEEKRHWGYIIYDQPNKDITQLYCTCRDFYFRLYAPYVRKKLANYNNYPLYAKYKKASRDTYPTPHNKQWTIQTNPSGNLYCCKHLYAALKGYVEDDNGPTPKKPAAAPEVPATPVKVMVSLNGKPAEEKVVNIPTAQIKKWGTGVNAQRNKQAFVDDYFKKAGSRHVEVTDWL